MLLNSKTIKLKVGKSTFTEDPENERKWKVSVSNFPPF